MSFVAVAIGTIAVGTAIYSADKQRKLVHQQQDALAASQQQDAIDAAAAETSAAVAANQKIADKNRRRRTSALGLAGDTLSSTLGGPATALSGGATAVRAPAIPSAIGGTAIGGGAPAGAPASASPYRPGGSGGRSSYSQVPY